MVNSYQKGEFVIHIDINPVFLLIIQNMIGFEKLFTTLKISTF